MNLGKMRTKKDSAKNKYVFSFRNKVIYLLNAENCNVFRLFKGLVFYHHFKKISDKAIIQTYICKNSGKSVLLQNNIEIRIIHLL